MRRDLVLDRDVEASARVRREALDPSVPCEILDEEEGEVVGKLKVAKVKEKISYCEVTDGESEPESGTAVYAE